MQLKLHLVVWNANGLQNSKAIVEHHLKTHQIDILLVAETHFSPRSHFNISGYDLIHADHPSGRARGGAAILIRSGIQYLELPAFQQDWAQCPVIRIVSPQGDLDIGAVYFPPRYRITASHLSEFFEHFGPRFIAAGDYNAKHSWWGSRANNPKGKTLFGYLQRHRLDCHSTGEPTHWPTNPLKTPDLLDFAVSKGIGHAKISCTTNADLLSDHCAINVLINTPVLRKTPLRRLTGKYTDAAKFASWMLSTVNPNPILNTPRNIDEAIGNLTRQMQNAAEFASPPPPKTARTPSRDLHLWSPEIAALVTEKRRLRRVWFLTRNPRDKTALNHATKELKDKISSLRQDSFLRFLEELSPGDPDHNLWNVTRHIKRPAKKVSAVRKADGSWCRSDAERAEAFAEHLYNAFSPFDCCTAEEHAETARFLNSPSSPGPPLEPVDPEEVAQEIALLKNNKSPGLDRIDAAALKMLPFRCTQMLASIYNSCFRLGYFPEEWKRAEVIVLLKPGKPEANLASYRPISLLAILSKILERVFLRRVLPVLDEAGLIPDHQFGFRRSHGTPEQCHRLVERILEAFEQKKYCCAVMLDVKQAFDRVWHPGLLHKLKSYLPSPHFTLLKSYTEGRAFQVRCGSAISLPRLIRAGVPQGSVLGPILYTLYTADLPIIPSRNLTIATYADDTAFLASSSDPREASETIQRQMDALHPWLSRWNIVVNAEKSTQTTFALRRGDCPPVTLNGVIIPNAPAPKYLGLTLDRRLTWRPHIVSKRIQADARLRQMHWLIGRGSKLRQNHKILVYKAILKPIWTYGIQLWGTASHTNRLRIQRFQNRCLRIACNAHPYHENVAIHRELGIPQVADEISRLSERYLKRLENHPNHLATNLLDNSQTSRRLMRRHPLDLPQQ